MANNPAQVYGTTAPTGVMQAAQRQVPTPANAQPQAAPLQFITAPRIEQRPAPQQAPAPAPAAPMQQAPQFQPQVPQQLPPDAGANTFPGGLPRTADDVIAMMQAQQQPAVAPPMTHREAVVRALLGI